MPKYLAYVVSSAWPCGRGAAVRPGRAGCRQRPRTESRCRPRLPAALSRGSPCSAPLVPFRRCCEVPAGEPAPPGQGDVDEGDEGGDLDERADHAGQGLAAGDAEGGDGGGDGQLEVVAGDGEREGGGALVRQADA